MTQPDAMHHYKEAKRLLKSAEEMKYDSEAASVLMQLAAQHMGIYEMLVTPRNYYPYTLPNTFTTTSPFVTYGTGGESAGNVGSNL